MTDIVRRNPLDGLTLPSRVGSIEVRDSGPATRLVLRGARDAVGDRLGVTLSATPLRASSNGQRSALWLGPDEWLLIAPDVEHAALVRAAAQLDAAASTVDASQRNAALILEGPRVGDVLNAGCPLDFDLAAFPVGMCTRTIFGKAEIVLWREAEHRIRLEACRSYMPYIVGLLGDAVRDLGSHA